ncbi:MAG: hypothetical protein ACHQM6_03280 [Candidatus Kapaibacterium sp.]
MKTYLLLLLFAAFLSSCGKDYYSIATKTSPGKEYIIYKVHDSSFIAVPLEYRSELTPEVIREYGKTFSYDSLTQLRRIPSAFSVGRTIAFGCIGGAMVGGATGYAMYKLESSGGFGSLGPEAHIAIGSILGTIPGFIIGYLLRPNEEDMLPKIRERK